ncbi:MAG: AGE family epimerase/isomerase [Algicola sp.]|nr:AGE family epimerase/isomerase [Algicola sp.]
MTTEQLKRQVYAELRDNILPFWQTVARDRKNGGYVGQMDIQGVVDDQADKSVIAHARILWSFSTAYSECKDARYLDQAMETFDYLINHFIDKEFSGVFHTLTFDGKVVNDDKDMVAQAYVVFALCAYYQASQETPALRYAVLIAASIETYARDISSGNYSLDTYCKVLTRDWQRKNDPDESRHAQVHLHLIEAYTALLACDFDQPIAASLKRLLELFCHRFVESSSHYVIQGYGQKWHGPSDKRLYGHDLEAACLLAQGAEVLGNDSLIRRCNEYGLSLVDQVIASHGASNNGISLGINLGVIKGESIDNQRNGWVQAEAISAFSWAYKVTGKAIYRQWLLGTWAYVMRFIKDHQHGDWFSGRNEDGSLVEDQLKIGPWKCPYHSVRACLTFYRQLDPSFENHAQPQTQTHSQPQTLSKTLQQEVI